MKTCVLASNWGAYFFPWAQSETVHIHSPQILNDPAQLAQYDKIVALNGIGEHWLLHPNVAQRNSYFFLWDMARCPHYAPNLALLEHLKTVHKCYSFQREDCRDFGLHFNSTMYAPLPTLPPAQDNFDVLFLGVPKDRLPQLRRLHGQLQAMGLRTQFRVALTQHDQTMPEAKPGWLLTRGWLAYPEYLALVRQSRCLLDYYQSGQTGFSLRVMEHVYFGCKLITNNPAIKQAEFAHPHNIFLLGENDMASLPAWLNLPFVPIAEKFREYYHIEEWAKRFT